MKKTIRLLLVCLLVGITAGCTQNGYTQPHYFQSEEYKVPMDILPDVLAQIEGLSMFYEEEFSEEYQSYVRDLLGKDTKFSYQPNSNSEKPDSIVIQTKGDFTDPEVFMRSCVYTVMSFPTLDSEQGKIEYIFLYFNDSQKDSFLYSYLPDGDKANFENIRISSHFGTDLSNMQALSDAYYKYAKKYDFNYTNQSPPSEWDLFIRRKRPTSSESTP